VKKIQSNVSAVSDSDVGDLYNVNYDLDRFSVCRWSSIVPHKQMTASS